MKKLKSLWAAVAGTMIAGSFLWAAAAPADPGKKIYDSRCASCHGVDGKGKPVMARMFKVDPSALDLTSPPVTAKKDEELLKVIAEGKNKMPAYSKQLKAEDQKAVLARVRSLAPKKEEKPKEEKAKEEKPAEKSAVEKPAGDKPAVEKPAVEKPVGDKPAVEKPAEKPAEGTAK